LQHGELARIRHGLVGRRASDAQRVVQRLEFDKGEQEGRPRRKEEILTN
jgi:hypothetical protein